MGVLKPEYIVVHTAAYRGPNCDRDVIDRWHKGRGWLGVGYHYVILNDKHDLLPDGEIQNGRDISAVGAHVKGLNQRSIGICCVGHGDYEPFTDRQYSSLVSLISNLVDQYEDMRIEHVIGHREVNKLVADGVLGQEYRTTKTCPGKLVDMDQTRADIREYREQSTPDADTDGEAVATEDEILSALRVLSRIPHDMFANARSELKEFLTHPEVVSFLDR